MPVNITGSKLRTWTDTDADGAIDPGEVLHHVIRLINTGDTDALNVTATDPLSGSTIDAGSVEISPIANNDAFSITGNTPFSFTAAQLLVNDVDPDGDEAFLTISNVSAGSNGTIIDNGGGSYTFIADTGLDVNATATFTYTVSDEQGHTSVSGYEGTVTMTVTDVVWYVNNSYGGVNGASDGSYLRPYTSMTALNGATGDGSTGDDVDAANDTIFVYQNGIATQGAITLENGQKLFGDGHAFTANGISIGNSGSNSTMTAASGTIVTLGQNNTIDGIILSSASTATGMTGTNFGTATISNTVIDTIGSGLSLDTGTVAGAGFSTVNSGSGTTNVSLHSVAGTVNLGTGTLSHGSVAALDIVGGSAAIDYNGNIVQGTSLGYAVAVSAGHSGSLTLDGTVSATSGQGMIFTEATGSYDFNGAIALSSSGADTAIDISNNSHGTFTFDNAGNSLNNSNNGGNAFTVTNSNANVTWNGNITDNEGNAVYIVNHDGGTVTFQNGTISATGAFAEGIDVTNSNGGSVNFNGSTQLSTQGHAAVILTGNTGGTINFATTGNGLDITTTTGTGFNATGGGTVTVSGSGNTIGATGGTALNIVDTTIGASDVTFQRVSASGGSVGINLSNTGSAGGLHITGTGSAGSGGTIENTSGVDAPAPLANATNVGSGIFLNDTADVQLAWMKINSNSNFGIKGLGVTDFAIANSSVEYNGTNTTGDEGGIIFGTRGGANGLTGTASVTSTTVVGSFEDNIGIYNSSGTLDLTVTGLTSSYAGNDGVGIEQHGGTVNVSVNGSTFVNNDGDAFGHLANGASDFSANFGNTSGNTSTSTFASVLGGGILVQTDESWTGMGATNIANNTFTGTGGANARGTVINIDSSGTGTLGAIINNNNVGQSGVFGSGTVANGDAIRIAQNGNGNGGAGTINALITNNDLYNVNGRGIYALALDGGTAGDRLEINLTIQGNTFQQSSAANGPAIRIDSTANVADFARIHANIGGTGAEQNVFTGDWGVTPSGGGADQNEIRIVDNAGDSQIVLTNLGGAANLAAIATYLTGRNNYSAVGGNGGTSSAAGTFASYSSGGSPPQPLLADTSGVSDTPTPSPTPAPTPAEPAGETDASDHTSTPTPAPAPSHPVIVDDGVLSQAELDWFVEAAIQRWITAGASAAQVEAMRATAFSVSDMAGVYLGSSSGSVVQIDSDGAGFGWFLDGTPGDDAEFSGSGTRLAATGEAAHRIDLLTTLLHELGHSAGLHDSYAQANRDSLMYGYAAPGERRLPAQGEADGATPHGDDGHEAYMLGPVNVGTLPAGKAVEIYYDSTVDSFDSEVIPTPIDSQPTVTGSNFSDYNLAVSSLAIDTLTLGNFVFLDANRNGAFDGGDSGIDGATISLYADADNDGVTDGAAIATTTTAGGGFYAFTSLAQGNYIVAVDADNFLGGGVLEGRVPTASGGDPDNNVNDDSNGGAINPQGSMSGSITLDYNSEPTPGTGNDSNSTLDFGFFIPNVAPAIGNVTGDSVSYTEDGAPVRLDLSLDGTITDSDGADFAGGSLSLEITAGEVASEDALELLFGGALSLSGLDVLVDGTTIGTITAGGTAGDPWSMSLNADATPARVQEVLRALAYTNLNGTTPDTGARTVTITLVDGDGTAGGGADTGTATVTVNLTPVNDAPAGGDETVVLNEDDVHPFSVSDFNFGDTDGGSLTEVVITTLPTDGTLYLDGTPITVAGTAVSAADIAAGLLTFGPDANENGTGYASLTFQVRDDGGTDSGGQDTDQTPRTITFNVLALNDLPSVAVQDAAVDGTEDTDLVFDAASSNAITVADADGVLAVTVGVLNGTLTLSQTTGLSFLTGDGAGDETMTFSGSVADINDALEGLTYRGELNYEGSDTLSVSVDDGEAPVLSEDIAITLADDGTIDGDAGDNNPLAGTALGDLFDLGQGGDDMATGLDGNDGFYMGAALSLLDNLDGGAGTDDQLGLQGNYGTSGTPFVLAATHLVNIETIVLLSGADTRFGDTSNSIYDYYLRTVDENVGSLQKLTVNFNALGADEDVFFDGSAESDGWFFTYGGRGVDTIIGGSQSDGFYFGNNGRWGSGDSVTGGGGADDQLGLQGSYAVTFGGTQMSGIETLVLMSGGDTRFGNPAGVGYSYDVTMNDGNVAGLATLTVNANTLRADVPGVTDEVLVFNGSAELDGHFSVMGGRAGDTISGGALSDLIWGGLGGDTLTGNGGADTFRYTNVAQSRIGGFDTLVDFDDALDKIDLPTAIASFATATTGALSFGSMAATLEGSHGSLALGQAVVFTADGGDMDDRIFLLLNTNGTAGFQAASDFVIELVNPSAIDNLGMFI